MHFIEKAHMFVLSDIKKDSDFMKKILEQTRLILVDLYESDKKELSVIDQGKNLNNKQILDEYFAFNRKK